MSKLLKKFDKYRYTFYLVTSEENLNAAGWHSHLIRLWDGMDGFVVHTALKFEAVILPAQ